MPEITLDLISTRQACHLLGDIDKTTLLDWVHQGKIRVAHKGPKNSGYLFDRGYIEKFAEDLRILAALPPADTLPGLDVDQPIAGGTR
jgi:hypothetical protein